MPFSSWSSGHAALSMPGWTKCTAESVVRRLSFTKVVREVTNPLRRALLLPLVLVVGGCSDGPNGLYLDTQGRP